MIINWKIKSGFNNIFKNKPPLPNPLTNLPSTMIILAAMFRMLADLPGGAAGLQVALGMTGTVRQLVTLAGLRCWAGCPLHGCCD